MKSIEQIKAKLEYEKKKYKEYHGCTEGTDGYVLFQIAQTRMHLLEWILKD